MTLYLQTEIASNSIQTWIIALAIALTTMVVVGVVRFISMKYLHKLVDQRAASAWDILLKVIGRTSWFFIFILALFVGSLVVELPENVHRFLDSITIISLLIQAGLWASLTLQLGIDQYRKHKITEDPASVTTLNVLSFIGKVMLWAFVLLLVLDNLGVNITALVAGMGIGGIAIALAVQAILGDLFSSLSIVLDKPFVIGDFLIVGDLLGTVEHVGLKTTRLRSLSGEQLIFSNSDLLSSRIRNYGRMYERRVLFNIGVTYQTPREKLIRIPEIISDAVAQQDKTRFDRSNFKEYGNFSLNFESVYYVLGPDYNEYMNIQQAINLCIHEAFEHEGIEFAYPTQTLFVQQLPQAGDQGETPATS
ncbi:MAG: mechanosensitive ion channel protein MscS [Zetaproteobacteria bacterium CG1_02_53_45]|nr:MAG: mechanosensitive ion channel protein MscS [Zetaproteobacteria bacterium CG1_02_53_45]